MHIQNGHIKSNSDNNKANVCQADNFISDKQIYNSILIKELNLSISSSKLPKIHYRVNANNCT